MRKVGWKTLTVLAWLVSGAAGSLAADVITVPTSSAAALPVHDEAGFDWSGFYAGVYGGIRTTDADPQFGLGVTAGVNAQFDFYLVGAEVAVEGLTGDVGDTTHGQILGRAGLVLADDMLVYAAGGYGIDLGVSDDPDVLLGGGVELAITDELSLDARYLRGLPLDGGDETNQFTLGARFHF